MTTTISVDGMSCGHCEQTIEETLRGVVDTADLVRAIEDAGYTVHA